MGIYAVVYRSEYNNRKTVFLKLPRGTYIRNYGQKKFKKEKLIKEIDHVEIDDTTK